MDAGFLHGAAYRPGEPHRGPGRLDAAACVRWFNRFGVHRDSVSRLARVYWYDAISRRERRGYVEELAHFRLLDQTPKLTVRLGTVVEQRLPWQAEVAEALDALGWERARFERHVSLTSRRVQKGVDVQLAIDLVTLATRQAIDTAVVMSGDGDLAPAFERARAEGVRVILAFPRGARPSVSDDLLSCVDAHIELDRRATWELIPALA